MNFISKSAKTLAKATSGNPIVSIAVTILFYILFDYMESIIEKLIFGKPFVHWLDPIIVGLTIIYSMLAVHECAMFKYEN